MAERPRAAPLAAARGFAPYVGYTYERSRSTIPLHAYENHGAILGLTREF